MTIIRMRSFLPGMYREGSPWPPAGGEIDVLPEHAADLIAGGHAENPYPPPPEPAAVIPEAVAAVRDGPAAEPPVTEPAAEVPPDPPADEVPVPAPADPKTAWIAYAVSRARTPEEADAARNILTKADLMSRYGGRL